MPCRKPTEPKCYQTFCRSLEDNHLRGASYAFPPPHSPWIFTKENRLSIFSPCGRKCRSQSELPSEWEGFFTPTKSSVLSWPDAGHAGFFLFGLCYSTSPSAAATAQNWPGLKLLSCVTKKLHLGKCSYRSPKDLFKWHYFQILSLYQDRIGRWCIEIEVYVSTYIEREKRTFK